MERGGLNCSGMRESMSSNISSVTGIIPELTRYAEKARWGC